MNFYKLLVWIILTQNFNLKNFFLTYFNQIEIKYFRYFQEKKMILILNLRKILLEIFLFRSTINKIH